MKENIPCTHKSGFFDKGMSTPPKLGKKLRVITESPTVLAAAVRGALRGSGEAYLLELIVEYANSKERSNLSQLAELLLRALGEIHMQGDPTDEQSATIQRASVELQKFRAQFRAALTWLCSSKDTNPPASLSVERLGTVEWGRYPLIDKISENFIRYFENHGLMHFKNRLSLQEDRLLVVPKLTHFVDLFCGCVLNRCIGKKTSELPIKICPRCNKFFLSERGKYCSQECQWKHYWTPERRSDDKWVKDLEKFSQSCKPKYGRSISDLQEKLALPRVHDRLISIKEKIKREDWTGWTTIAKKIAAVEKLAGKSIE